MDTFTELRQLRRWSDWTRRRLSRPALFHTNIWRCSALPTPAQRAIIA